MVGLVADRQTLPPIARVEPGAVTVHSQAAAVALVARQGEKTQVQRETLIQRAAAVLVVAAVAVVPGLPGLVVLVGSREPGRAAAVDQRMQGPRAVQVRGASAGSGRSNAR